MPAPITSRPFVPPGPLPIAAGPAEASSAGPDFARLLRTAVGRTAEMQQQADATVMAALAGGDVTQVEVLSGVKKADLAMRTMMQVRNKILDAYNEIQQLRF